MPTCPNCHQDSPEGFRFCPHCGHALTQAPPPRTERKVVTVLFCDLVGFTARSDRADPEDVRAILRPFHQLAKAQIERYGGTLDKFIGDAAMGVFGWPAAHEDDPERAVRAGLGIVEAVAALKAVAGEEPLAVRVGVNTGEAVVTLAQGVQIGENVAGDVVNTASRLQEAAPEGAVIVGEATYRATTGAVRFEELETVSAKGKAEPLRAWVARSIRTLPAISDRAPTTPFVGRRRERGVLEQAVVRALTEPGVQLITVVGEPGVGKSRLVAELRRSLPGLVPDLRVQWRRGRCLPYGEGMTFWALGEIVKDQAGILESDSPQDRRNKLADLLDRPLMEPSERAWLRARLAPLVGAEAGGPVERDEAFAAWLRFLEATARATPLVAVVEDVHWADPAMVAFLEYLAEHALPVPMGVIATARPEFLDQHPEWAAGRANAVTISLPPLSEDDTTELVSALLNAPSIPEQTRHVVLERAGGNPLYAEELARTVLERGLIDRQGRVAGDGGLELPQTLQALIAARLDSLPPQDKLALQDASVIGTTFWSGAVGFLAGAPEAGVRAVLDQLATKEFLRSAAVSSMAGQAEFTFWHAVVRDVAYAQIPRADRAAKHRRAAEWTEAVAGERLDDVAEILVHHATAALELARAAGETEAAGDLERSAARYLRLAAHRTMALDVGKARSQLRRALELAPSGDPARPGIVAALAEAAFHAGGLEEADRLYEEAVAGLRAQGEVREAADAMVRRSVVLEYRGEVAAGRILLSNAIELLEELPPGPGLARALATSAGSSLVSGRYQEVIREADRAIELAETVREPQAAARAHCFRGYARAIEGDRAGLEEQRQALESLLALGEGRAAAIAYNNLGSCLAHVEGLAAAMGLMEEGEEFARGRGLGEMATAIRSSMLTVLFELGEWDEVLRLGAQVVEEARRHGSGFDEIFAEADRAAVLALRQGAAAGDLCESLVERARPLDDAPVLVRTLTAAATARSAAGDLPGTIAVIEEALEATGGEALVDRASELPQLVRLAVAAADLDLAGRLMDGMETLRLERYRLALAAARAVLAEARDDLTAALAAYEAIIPDWNRWGHALEEAHALFGSGRCLTRLGRRGTATERLRSAEEAFERLGAEPALAQVRSFSE